MKEVNIGPYYKGGGRGKGKSKNNTVAISRTLTVQALPGVGMETLERCYHVTVTASIYLAPCMCQAPSLLDLFCFIAVL